MMNWIIIQMLLMMKWIIDNAYTHANLIPT
jgi:hypothetical protein